MSIPLQSGVVYGPVHSRRLGLSLGINLLPVREKFCLSSCVYCQYGPTDLEKMAEVKIPAASEILKKIQKGFEQQAAEKTTLHSITFSGNGEPTLHPQLEEIILGVREMRDRYFPDVRIGILSDSSRVHLLRVRQALELCDDRYMKLDAGDIETFRLINQPQIRVNWDAMIDGLKKLSSLTVQSLFLHGYPADNSGGRAFLDWLKVVGEIKPDAVQVYTIDRPPVDFRTKPVPKKRLSEIAALVFQAYGIDAFVFEGGEPGVLEQSCEKKWEF